MASIVSGIMCAFCYLFGVWVGRNKLKSNADQRTQRVKSVESVVADTPQNEQMKTADYCDICKQDMCKDCIADATNPYCVPSHYEINYEPKDEPKTQMKTQNSNLTFENRTMLDCYNCKRYKSDDACVECRYEPKADTPQTDRMTEEEIDTMLAKALVGQTDCGWK